MKRITHILFALPTLSGCVSNQTGPLPEYDSTYVDYGYEVTELNTNEFNIIFNTQIQTSRESAEQIWELKAKELCDTKKYNKRNIIITTEEGFNPYSKSLLGNDSGSASQMASGLSGFLAETILFGISVHEKIKYLKVSGDIICLK